MKLAIHYMVVYDILGKCDPLIAQWGEYRDLTSEARNDKDEEDYDASDVIKFFKTHDIDSLKLLKDKRGNALISYCECDITHVLTSCAICEVD